MTIKINNRKYHFKDDTPEEVVNIFLNREKTIPIEIYKKYKEYFPNTYKLVVGVCKHCGKKASRGLARLRERVLFDDELFCSITCFNKEAHKLDLWREHNSKAQKIAQNKESQKIKNSKGVRRSRKNWSREEFESWKKNVSEANKKKVKGKLVVKLLEKDGIMILFLEKGC